MPARAPRACVAPLIGCVLNAFEDYLAREASDVAEALAEGERCDSTGHMRPGETWL